MRLLLVHSYYQQSGGEEAVFHAEVELLRSRGHTVQTFTVHNRELAQLDAARQAAATVWNAQARRALREAIRSSAPEVVHFHNTFPALSPAVYYAARAEHVPVVQTLHNYRLLCPNALFFRNGAPCEACLGRAVAWPGVVHACYRQSRAASGVVATMLAVHRALRTWHRLVDVFVAPSAFARRKLIEGGLPADRLVVKPNFVADPGLGRRDGGYALYVGRLSAEKGVDTLLQAWTQLPEVPLRVVGDGPLRAEVEAALARSGAGAPVAVLGPRPPEEVRTLMQGATLLVFPSGCYEVSPRVVVEAFACGVPVVGADHGALTEIVEHGSTGLRYRPGDADALAATVRQAWTRPAQLAAMGARARAAYEETYTPERSYEMLLDVYHTAAAGRIHPSTLARSA